MATSVHMAIYVGVVVQEEDLFEVVPWPVDCGHTNVGRASFCQCCGRDLRKEEEKTRPLYPRLIEDPEDADGPWVWRLADLWDSEEVRFIVGKQLHLSGDVMYGSLVEHCWCISPATIRRHEDQVLEGLGKLGALGLVGDGKQVQLLVVPDVG